MRRGGSGGIRPASPCMVAAVHRIAISWKPRFRSWPQRYSPGCRWRPPETDLALPQLCRCAYRTCCCVAMASRRIKGSDPMTGPALPQLQCMREAAEQNHVNLCTHREISKTLRRCTCLDTASVRMLSHCFKTLLRCAGSGTASRHCFTAFGALTLATASRHCYTAHAFCLSWPLGLQLATAAMPVRSEVLNMGFQEMAIRCCT